MAYAVLADYTLFGLVASALSTVPNDVKQAALDSASEFVDGYLRSRYRLPLSDWGQEIVEITVIIAVWHLMSRRGFMPSAGADTVIRQRYDDALNWLNRVGRQEITPNVTPNTFDIAVLAAPRVITREKRGW
jgi:phage gp36-like protein